MPDDTDPLDEIRNDVRAALRSAYEKLLQQGYQRHSAKALLQRMASGIVTQFED